MIDSRIAMAGLIAIVLILVPACSNGDNTESGAESSLDEGFLQPLEKANIDYDVVSACHYDRTAQGDAWHFAVHLAIDADMQTSEAALSATVDIIDERRPSAIVQQVAGSPAKGWTGQLTDNGDTTVLDLVKNNIDVDSGGRPSVGWLPVCTESIPG